MCEPHHSVVQYRDHEDDDMDLPQSGQMTMDQRVRSALGEKVMAWGKKIRQWFHFSRMGSGHTNAIELTGHASRILPAHTRYEGVWWERRFQIDGPFHGPSVFKKEAIESADSYYQEVVMKNMSTFRRFLETSMEQSSFPYQYANRLMENVLTSAGRDKLAKKIESVFGVRKIGYSSPLVTVFANVNNRDKAIKLVMGHTRDRKMFQSHFADDTKLWT